MKLDQPISVVNPWQKRESAYSRSIYTIETHPVFSHRGVDVYRYPAGGFLHVFAGMAIRHLCGCDKTGKAIDELLDGVETYCCDTVAAHLRKYGFTPKAYSEAV